MKKKKEKNNVKLIGRISLWTSLGGFILPLIFFFLAVFVFSEEKRNSFIFVSVAVLLTFQLIGITTGFGGIKTTAGKSGLIISLIIFIAVVLLILSTWLTQLK